MLESLRARTVLSLCLPLASACAGQPSAAPTPPAAAPRAAAPATPGPTVLAQGPEAPAAEETAADPEMSEPGTIAVGTFSLNWAFDATDDRSELANGSNAATEDDWEWKVRSIAEILAAQKLDVVALQGLGGERELAELVTRIRELDGPQYEFAFEAGTDLFTAQQVAILSRFSLDNSRRFDVNVSKHLAVDAELPSGQKVTFVTFHLRSGRYSAQAEARIKEAGALKRKVARLKNPVVLLGDARSLVLPRADEYATSEVGVFAGADTRGKEDDCMDSAQWGLAQETYVPTDEPFDRVFACGLEMVAARAVGAEAIVRGEADPQDKQWSEVPVDDGSMRDVSDHLLVRAALRPAGE